MIAQQALDISTCGRGTYNITGEIADLVRRSGIRTGLCQVVVQHTSAALVICENADPGCVSGGVRQRATR